MHSILKRKFLDIDCKEAAKERIRYLFKVYDCVIVNFSGGKDSTALLYLTIEVARELNKLPVEAVYIDHEVEGLHTTEFVEKIYRMKEVNLAYYAIPFSCRNATSMRHPLWYPWHPAERELWVREKPSFALTEMPGHYFEYDPDYKHPDGLPFMAGAVKRSMTFQQVVDLYRMNKQKQGLTCVSLVGLRAQESLARYTVMLRKRNECYISSTDSIAYPIYDWHAKDVWKYIRETGLPYNHEYDIMNKGENYNQLNKQRVGSIFGEESLRTLDHWQIYYRDFWHKIVSRVEGVKTAWRYCNEGIYSGTRITKRDDLTWEQYTKLILQQMEPAVRDVSLRAIKKIVVWHKNQTDYPIADKKEDACPLTGISWEFLARIAIRGDTKERNLQKVPSLAKKAREKHKLTREQAVLLYGKEEYKRRFFAEKAARRASNASGQSEMGSQVRVETKQLQS